MELIKKLQEQEKDLMRLLEEVREQIKQECARFASEKYGVKPGSIVKDKGRQFRVVRIKHPFVSGDGKPPLVVNAKRTNGDFNVYQEYLYHWELAE